MDYYTNQNRLILPEYGRNVQQLVEQAIDIEDKEERSKFVLKIIELMGRMYPYLRDLKDFKHKLWDHLVIMSDFKLEIDSPFPRPVSQTYAEYPAKIPYPNKNFKYKHYGKTVGTILKFIVGMPEGQDKIILTGLIANHMRKLYLTWSKEIVEDREIFEDITELSNGKVEIPDGMTLSNIRVQYNKPKVNKHFTSKRKKTYKKK